jgi:hypothetical protein
LDIMFFMVKLILLLSILNLSWSTLAQDEMLENNVSGSEEPARPLAPPMTKGKEGLIDKKVPAHEKVWLPVAGSPSLAFYLSEITGKAHGGVILLPKLNHHPAGQGSTNTMRHALAQNHWHTLALNPGDANQTRITELVVAAILYLNQQGIYNIAILGEGLGGAQALEYVGGLKPKNPSKKQFNSIRALVMINSENLLPGSENNPLEKLSTIKMPILDAFSNNDFRQQSQSDERKRSALQSANQSYHQVRLPLLAAWQENTDNRITKRIRGWLDKNVAGFMIDQ